MKRAVLLLWLFACAREPERVTAPTVVSVPDITGPMQIGDGNVQTNEMTVAPQDAFEAPPGNYVISTVDSGASALWLGGVVPSATNYTMASDGCGHHIVQRNGVPIRDFARCDAAFDGCFRGCGASIAHSQGWPSDAQQQTHWADVAAACVDECDRRIPRGAFIDLGDGGHIRGHGVRIMMTDAGDVNIGNHP